MSVNQLAFKGKKNKCIRSSLPVLTNVTIKWMMLRAFFFSVKRKICTFAGNVPQFSVAKHTAAAKLKAKSKNRALALTENALLLSPCLCVHFSFLFVLRYQSMCSTCV